MTDQSSAVGGTGTGTQQFSAGTSTTSSGNVAQNQPPESEDTAARREEQELSELIGKLEKKLVEANDALRQCEAGRGSESKALQDAIAALGRRHTDLKLELLGLQDKLCKLLRTGQWTPGGAETVKERDVLKKELELVRERLRVVEDNYEVQRNRGLWKRLWNS